MTDHAEVLKAQFRIASAEHRADPNLLQLRLLNWARWCRDNSMRVLSCRSIEHRYKSPQCWFPEEPKIEVDELDAAKVEVTVGKLPRLVRIALAAHYIYGGRYERNIKTRRFACQDMAINWSMYEETVEKAEKMLANSLGIK